MVLFAVNASFPPQAPMATKRRRDSDNWEFVVKRKGLLPRPLYLTFASEEEGDRYVQRLEALLDRGVVPDEFRRQQGDIVGRVELRVRGK